MTKLSGVPQGTLKWEDLLCGDGGYNLIFKATANYEIKTTDTGGILIRRLVSGSWTVWKQLISASFMGASYSFPLAGLIQGGYGVWAMDVCDGDPNYGAFIYDGYLWVTSDAWLTVTRSPLPRLAANQCDANASYEKFVFGKLRIDPAQSLVIYFITKTGGVQRTLDRGANWTTIATVPAPDTFSKFVGTGSQSGFTFTRLSTTSGSLAIGDELQIAGGAPMTILSGTDPVYTTSVSQSVAGPAAVTAYASKSGFRYGMIEFKRGSGTTGTPARTAGVFAHVSDGGLYESTNGGDAFTSRGGTVLATQLACDSTGRLYIAGYTNGLSYFEAGSHTNLGLFSLTTISNIAVKGDDDNFIVFSAGTGAFRVTRDRFGTAPIGGLWQYVMESGDAPMISYEINRSGLSGFGISNNGALSFYQNNTKVGIPFGYGFCYLSVAQIPTTHLSTDTLIFYEDTAGGNELVAQFAEYLPADATMTRFNLWMSCQDRGLVGWPAPRHPGARRGSTKFMPFVGGLVQGFTISWHPSAPHYWVAYIIRQQPVYQSELVETYDYGKTWSTVPNSIGSGNLHGCVAVMGVRKIVMVRFGTFVPQVWTGGDTPSNIKVGGSDMTSTSWATVQNGLNGTRRLVAAANPNTTNEVMIYCQGGGSGNYGAYYSTDGGANMTRTDTSLILSGIVSVAHAKLRWGKSGRKYLTAGQSGSGDWGVDLPTNYPLYTDAANCSGWTQITNCSQVHDLWLGAPANAGDPEVVWIHGFVGGVRGLYASYDLTATWVRQSDPPIFDRPYGGAADPYTYGRVAIPKSGTGTVEGIYDSTVAS